MFKAKRFSWAAWAVMMSLCCPHVFAADSSLPNMNELMKRFIHRSLEEDEERLDKKYGYDEHRITEHFDENGGVRQSGMIRYSLIWWMAAALKG